MEQENLWIISQVSQIQVSSHTLEMYLLTAPHPLHHSSNYVFSSCVDMCSQSKRKDFKNQGQVYVIHPL